MKTVNTTRDNPLFSEETSKKATKLSKAFLRPAYQYTSQEIVNWQRQKWIKEYEEKIKQEQINACNKRLGMIN